MKQVFAPHLGRHVTFGRRRPLVTAESHPHLFKSASKYALASTLPAAPAKVDFYSAARAALGDVLGNDSLGDCTAAGACHLVESITANAGAPVALSREQAIAFYAQSCGYVPGNPATDQGGDEIAVLTSWRDKGLDGKGAHAIKGWLSVDPSNPALIATCNWLFGGLYFGVELPLSWTSPMPSGDGFVWDADKPDMEQGHCFVGVGSDARGIQIDTWGLIGTITYAAIARLCMPGSYGNLFAVLTDEIISKARGLAPSGFDWEQLVADFDDEGGSVPLPPPAPRPAPTSPPSCAEAQAAVSSALAAGHPLMTREQAMATAASALAPLWPSS